jgi:hypothetical protein
MDRPLARREPLTIGGKLDKVYGSAGAMLVPMGDDVPLRVDILDRQVGIQPAGALKSSQAAWTAARGDGRNSGAHPLRVEASLVPTAGTAARSLIAFPNPGGGNFQFRLSGVAPTAGLRLEIFDLRGRRVQVLGADFAAGSVRWDGRDRDGRPLAAGAYLAVVRGAGQPVKTRIVLAH